MAQLPVIKYKGKKYYRDDRLKQIRNVNNPHDVIDFDELSMFELAGMAHKAKRKVRKGKGKKK